VSCVNINECEKGVTNGYNRNAVSRMTVLMNTVVKMDLVILTLLSTEENANRQMSASLEETIAMKPGKWEGDERTPPASAPALAPAPTPKTTCT
jgi:hypothetical protein